MHVVYRDGERRYRTGNILWPISDFYCFAGIRFYLFIFCATLTNVLITLLLQVRDPQSSYLTRDPSDHGMCQIYFSGIGSEFVYPHCLPRNLRLTLLFLSHSIEIVLHSILTCRLMIGIREASQLSGRKSETFELSEVPDDGTLVFARRSSVETARIA